MVLNLSPDIYQLILQLLDAEDICYNKSIHMKDSPSNSLFLQQNHISAMGFSPKADFCAIATKKDHTVNIFRVVKANDINTWELLQKITDHTQTISDVDWAADNKIITSSHDRSVFVWKQSNPSEFKWKRQLVNIDIKLSILVSKWAPSAKKFALGSSCNTIALGFFNIESQCWTVSTRNSHSKNPVSTSPIITLCFHPSSNLLAVGTADFQVKIVTSSFKKSKDKLVIESKVEDNSYKGPFEQIDTLFQILYTIDNVGGWVNHVSFQNQGSNLLILPHLNHIKVLDISTSGNIVQKEEDIRWNGLPFLSGYINQNRELVLGGFDKKVAKFASKGGYVFDHFLQGNEKTGFTSKIGLVANMTRGIEKRESLYGKAPTEQEHVNTIKVLQVGGRPVSYDINGVIHFWTQV